MRVTNSMTTYNFLNSLNLAQYRQQVLNEKLSDNKDIHRPSDDPIKIMRSLRFKDQLMQNEQFAQNIADADSWMTVTDQALTDISNMLKNAQELVIRATMPQATIGYSAAAQQLDGIINQIVNTGNTKLGDQFVFSGQMDKTTPFARVKVTDPTGKSKVPIDTVVYYGDQNKISVLSQPGSVNPETDSISLSGQDVFGDSTITYGQNTVKMLNQLIRVKEELEKASFVQKSNAFSGKLVVDGTYNGQEEFQDYMVKIDSLKINATTYTPSNLNSGVLKLGYTGSLSNIPLNAQVRVDALEVGGTYTQTPAGLTHKMGDLLLETNGTAALPSDGVRVRVDAVQVQAGAVSKGNPLSGDVSVLYNGYRNNPVPANIQLRIDTVDPAGAVTGLSYNDGSGWQAATADGVLPPGKFALNNGANNVGLIVAVAAKAENIVGNTYTMPLSSTGRVMEVSYQTANGGSGWNVATQIQGYNAAPPFALNPAVVPAMVGGDIVTPLRFSLGATGMFASIENIASNQIGDSHVIGNPAGGAAPPGPVYTGKVTAASYWDTSAAAYVACQAEKPAVLGGAYTFAMGATGLKAEMQTATNNLAGQTYTLNTLSSSGDPLDASYSFDRGNTWQKAVRPSIAMSNGNGADAVLGGTFAGFPKEQTTIARLSLSTNSNLAFSPSIAGAGQVSMTYNGTAAFPGATPVDRIRIDAANNLGKVTAASYSTDGGVTWSQAAIANPSADPQYFTFGNTGFSGFVGTNALNTVGVVYSPNGAPPFAATGLSQVTYSVDGGKTWGLASVDPAVSPNLFTLQDGITMKVDMSKTANTCGDSYTFKAPPEFSLANGVDVRIATNAANNAGDGYTFCMEKNKPAPGENAQDTEGPSLIWLSHKGLADVNQFHDSVLQVQTQVGTRAAMYKMVAEMMDDRNYVITQNLSTNEDLDVPKAITDLKTAENVYRTTLSVGSRIIPPSLVDFLR